MSRKNFVVLGCGRFGSSVAATLYEMGHDVLAIDSSAEIIQHIADKVTHAVQADCTDEMVLKSLGLGNFDVAVVSIGTDLHASIMATLLAKESGVPYVLCKATDERQAKVLYKIGANDVVFPERDMAVRVARSLISKNITEYIELDPQYSIAEISMPNRWVGKNLQELNLRAGYGLNVIAFKRDNVLDITPDPKKKRFREDDLLVVVGKVEAIEKIESLE